MQSAVKHFFGEGGGDLGCLERFLGLFGVLPIMGMLAFCTAYTVLFRIDCSGSTVLASTEQDFYTILDQLKRSLKALGALG